MIIMKRGYTIRQSGKGGFKDLRGLFRYYVKLLSPFMANISGRDADVFAEILYQNYLRKNIESKKDRFTLIFNSETRDEMVEVLNISPAIFRNSLSSLRRKKLLTANNLVHDSFLIEEDLGEDLEISFKFVSEKNSILEEN